MWKEDTVLTHDLAPQQCHAQSVYDFSKNPPVSVNICVGKTQHEVAYPAVFVFSVDPCTFRKC